MVLNAGFQTNTSLLPVLADKDTLILSDWLNHNSIIQGCHLSRCDVVKYKHNDLEHLSHLLNENQHYKRRIIVTESVFSMDGDIAPLDKIVMLAEKYNCLVMIDEAHAFGVLGKSGRGLAEHAKG